MQYERITPQEDIYVQKKDVAEEKYGLTPGCNGCEAANQGTVEIHNERCGGRVGKEICMAEPEGFDRTQLR